MTSKKQNANDAVGLQQASLRESTNGIISNIRVKKNQNWFPAHSEAPSINKRIRKQVEREVCFWAGRAALRPQPPVIPIPLNFTVHHFNQSLPGPPPSRGSLTDGLFNWHWGSGAQPRSWDGSRPRARRLLSGPIRKTCISVTAR